MRTPTVMIVGLVLCPCSLILTLTSTLAPNWRDVSRVPGQALDMTQHQGIWDICNEHVSTRQTQCGISDDHNYFPQQPVKVARGLMVTSLAVTVLGLVMASLGVRCWQEEPHYLLAGVSGLVLFIAGLMSLIPLSWYNHELSKLPFATGSTLQVGYSLVLGYLGSCLELIGGFFLALSFAQCWEEWRIGKKTRKSDYPPSGQQAPATTHSIASRELQSQYRTPTPRSYSNPLDVLEGERASHSFRSTLPCDSDL
uniref:Claudin 23 n=1 Tax=Sphenodon punctatus TaxID=8508 RepID=A0A8D0HDZ1_SPHPU